MLVQCKSCNVSFDLALGNCIVCGTTYVLSEDEQRSECLKVVDRLAHQGKKKLEIRDYLIETDLFADEEIREILKAVKESQEAQHAGGPLLLFTIGTLLLTLGNSGLFGSPFLLFLCYGIGGTFAVAGFVGFQSDKVNAKKDFG